jgi:hypothetical protein
MKRGIVCAGAAVFFLCATANAEMRIWTSRKGDTVDAEYVRMYGRKVVLKTAEGELLHVTADGLCDDDHEYLATVTAVPPKIQIEVDDDLERYKKAYGGYREDEEQTVTCNVVIQKTNTEPCLGNFKALLYIIGEEKEGTKKKILGIKQHAVSFVQQQSTEFSLTATVKNRTGYMWADGFEYEGYLVCIEDDGGEMVALETNINSYGTHRDIIRKSSTGSIYTEDFRKVR